MNSPVFDGYYAWLGIPPKDRNLNHYRLLGLELFECNLDVIEGAADRQMGFVRQYQSGEYAADAARILNELAVARLCLLNSATKEVYDATLRQQLAAPLLPPSQLTRTRPTSQATPASRLLIISGSIATGIVVLAVILFISRRKPTTERPDKPVNVAAEKTESTKANLTSASVDHRRPMLETPQRRTTDDSNANIVASQSTGSGSNSADSILGTVAPALTLSQDAEAARALDVASPTESVAADSEQVVQKPGVSATDVAAPGHSPATVPTLARQKEIAKDLEDAHNLSKLDSVAKKQVAVKKLLQASGDESISADERYVVLTTVISLARETGDGESWLEAVNALVNAFAADPHQEKMQLLMEFLKSGKPGKHLKLVVEEAIGMSQAVARENRYVDAQALLEAAAASARRAPGADSLKKLVAKASDAVAVREKDWKAFLSAVKTLETNADDPPSNFTMGRWHALQETDWTTALPFLAKASDSKWKAAAELEVAGATDALGQVAIGDAWFEIGENEPGTARTALLLHAGKWYEEAQPKLTSVLKKQAMTKHLEKIAMLKPKTTSAGQPAQPIVAAKKAWHGWPAKAPLPAIAPFDADQAKKHQEAWAAYLKVPVEYTNSIGMKFRLIPPGEFLMGDTASEINQVLLVASRDDLWQQHIRSGAPQHKVILTQPMYVGVHEVTQAEYEKVMGKNPSYFSPTGAGKGAVAGMDTTRHPVEMVSWNDAAEFCTKLSQQEKLKPFYLQDGETITYLDGTGYRLPTEAEWEFACRAGTTTRMWNGDQDGDLGAAGWCGTNSGGRTHTVGSAKANPFQLFDVHGNVWEWVQDWWEPTFYSEFIEKPALNPTGPLRDSPSRVDRGGNWKDHACRSRASDRCAHGAQARSYDIGFRISLVAFGSRAGRP